MKQRIVVADDDTDTLFMMVTVLQNKGYEVLGLSDATAIMEGRCIWPDLFILDNEMEFFTGLAVIRFLKTTDGANSIPIMMVSGSSNVQEATAAGADVFMTKPVNAVNFLAAIDSLLNRKSPLTD